MDLSARVHVFDLDFLPIMYLLIRHLLVNSVKVPGAELLGQAYQLLLSKAKLLQHILLTTWVHLGLQHVSMRLK